MISNGFHILLIVVSFVQRAENEILGGNSNADRIRHVAVMDRPYRNDLQLKIQVNTVTYARSFLSCS